MRQRFCIGLVICAVINGCHAVSTKMDFGEEEDTVVTQNSTKIEDEDVEVKHTIVVSTKLKNNNRRGLHGNNGEPAIQISNTAKQTKDDSGEVPIVNGYKSVDTTLIRTPDTRHKEKQYPDSYFISRNLPDEYDLYPNYVVGSWKPSNYYNNIHLKNQDTGTDYRTSGWINRPPSQSPGKFHRRITDDGMKEFYCRRCRELNGIGDCGQLRSRSRIHETTTPKLKIDGKLAKLN